MIEGTRTRPDPAALLDDPAPTTTGQVRTWKRNRAGISAGDVDIPGLTGWLNRLSPRTWFVVWTLFGISGAAVLFAWSAAGWSPW